jgi:hypothetical protein
MSMAHSLASVSGPKLKLALRLVLTSIGILTGLVLDFTTLRLLNSAAITQVLGLLNTPYQTLDSLSFEVKGLGIFIDTSCTSIAAFLGSIALFWRSDWKVFNGLVRTFFIFFIFEAINVLRIAIGLFFFNLGYSWEITHTIPSGFFYFALLYWALRYGRWLTKSDGVTKFALPDSN